MSEWNRVCCNGCTSPTLILTCSLSQTSRHHVILSHEPAILQTHKQIERSTHAYALPSLFEDHGTQNLPKEIWDMRKRREWGRQDYRNTELCEEEKRLSYHCISPHQWLLAGDLFSSLCLSFNTCFTYFTTPR